MMLPTIHLNGTNARDLLEDQMKAMNAIREAIRLLAAAGPNGRDYYPQGAQAIQHALEEHDQRLLVLRNVLAEVEALAFHISQYVL